MAPRPGERPRRRKRPQKRTPEPGNARKKQTEEAHGVCVQGDWGNTRLSFGGKTKGKGSEFPGEEMILEVILKKRGVWLAGKGEA